MCLPCQASDQNLEILPAVESNDVADSPLGQLSQLVEENRQLRLLEARLSHLVEHLLKNHLLLQLLKHEPLLQPVVVELAHLFAIIKLCDDCLSE